MAALRQTITIATLVLLSTMTGCSALWEPSPAQVERWVATVPPHSPGRQMYDLLQRKGFSPRYGDHAIVGSRTYELLCLADYFEVKVDLDDEGNVVRTQVMRDSNLP